MTGCYFSYASTIEGMVRASCSSAVTRGVSPSVQMMALTWSVVVRVCVAGPVLDTSRKSLESTLQSGESENLLTNDKVSEFTSRLFDFAENCKL